MHLLNAISSTENVLFAEQNMVDDNEPAPTTEAAKTIAAIDRGTVHQICSGQVVLNLATAVKVGTRRLYKDLLMPFCPFFLILSFKFLNYHMCLFLINFIYNAFNCVELNRTHDPVPSKSSFFLESLVTTVGTYHLLE